MSCNPRGFPVTYWALFRAAAFPPNGAPLADFPKRFFFVSPMLTPKLIIGIALLFLLGSSGLSIANKAKLAALSDQITRSGAAAAAAQSDALRAKAEQKKVQKAAEDAAAKSNELQSQLATASSQVNDLNGKIKEAEDRASAKDKDIADLNARLLAASTAPKPAAPADDVTKQLEDLKRDRDELNVVKAGLDSQLHTVQAQVQALQKREADRASGASMQGLRGRVLAVDRNWNFVVLDLGNRNGVNNNATMIIERGGSMVGRIRITSVEPSQSVADIIPNSVPAGISVQPGDTVVFSGS